jgi:hypothetical protein
VCFVFCVMLGFILHRQSDMYVQSANLCEAMVINYHSLEPARPPGRVGGLIAHHTNINQDIRYWA